MSNSHNAGLFNRATDHYTKAIEEALKQLLQNKHLYQSQEVILPPFVEVYKASFKSYMAGTTPSSGERSIDFEAIFQMGKSIFWTINTNERRAGVYTDSKEVRAVVTFTPPTVRLYCSHCDCLQPYNYQLGSDVLHEFQWEEEEKRLEEESLPRLVTPGMPEESSEVKPRKVEQVFQLIYQCQGCKSLPEVFLIRRTNMKFTLCGRTPMEKVVVQPFIPKRQRDFFSGAIIAYQAGQILPGNFMLRTFIEQYVRSRSATPNSTNIEALFDEYNATLPEDFKNRFPSLSRIYDCLSEDIHGAVGSPDLFNQSKEEIEQHFDARRLFRIPD